MRVALSAFTLTLACTFALGACSDPPKPAPPTPAAPTAAPVAAAPKPVAPPAPPPAPKTPLEAARMRALTKDDFTESEKNRDPFRSFLSSFAVTQVKHGQHPILFEKFSVDELKLAAIVTGEVTPRAMFVDPSGQGVVIVRGDHISKADALVTRIAPDRVYLRIEEEAVGSEAPHITERQIELHAGELSTQ
jgi:type IV pilus assembly protein PilP